MGSAERMLFSRSWTGSRIKFNLGKLVYLEPVLHGGADPMVIIEIALMGAMFASPGGDSLRDYLAISVGYHVAIAHRE